MTRQSKSPARLLLPEYPISVLLLRAKGHLDIGLAVKAGDFSGFSAGVLSHDSPIVVRLTDRSEDHFCFCHDTLCRRYVQKTNSALLAAAR